MKNENNKMTTLLIQYLPIDILKNIESFNINYNPKKHTWDNLAKTGNLQGLKWLHENRTEGCTTSAMNYALHHNHQ